MNKTRGHTSFSSDCNEKKIKKSCFSLPGYLSYCSIALKKHHGQGNLSKKAFNWLLVLRFRGVVHDYYGGECGRGQAGLVLEQSGVCVCVVVGQVECLF